jgi:hypothetical protein
VSITLSQLFQQRSQALQQAPQAGGGGGGGAAAGQAPWLAQSAADLAPGAEQTRSDR